MCTFSRPNVKANCKHTLQLERFRPAGSIIRMSSYGHYISSSHSHGRISSPLNHSPPLHDASFPTPHAPNAQHHNIGHPFSASTSIPWPPWSCHRRRLCRVRETVRQPVDNMGLQPASARSGASWCAAWIQGIRSYVGRCVHVERLECVG